MFIYQIAQYHEDVKLKYKLKAIAVKMPSDSKISYKSKESDEAKYS